VPSGRENSKNWASVAGKTSRLIVLGGAFPFSLTSNVTKRFSSPQTFYISVANKRLKVFGHVSTRCLTPLLLTTNISKCMQKEA
jgi:hypothetical protein